MIGTVLDLVLGPLGALVGGLAVVLAAWAKGKRDGRQEAAQKALEDYQETRKRIDEVDIPDDDGVLREWLRERGER